MRLTRHAKNRLRFIAKRGPDLSERELLASLESATEIGKDVKGNRLVSVAIGGIILTVVMDDTNQVVITIWREE